MAEREKQVVNLVEAIQLVHSVVTTAMCETVFRELRTKERARKWTLEALVRFWVSVVNSGAPPSLRQALEECMGRRTVTPVESSPSSFFERCQTMPPEFFREVFVRFIAAVLADAPPTFEAELRAQLPEFPEVWVVDGSSLARVEKRLKALRDVEEVAIPGCVLACYDLWRGIPRRIEFYKKLLGGEASKLREFLAGIPQGTLLVADRGYASLRLLAAMNKRGLHGLVRMKRNHAATTVEELGRDTDEGCEVTDRIVTLGTGQKGTAPVRVRLIEKALPNGETLRLATTVLDPAKLPALVALALYRKRWTVERLFFDLKEVLDLKRFYAANSNAVAMQVFATAIVHAALRVTQARIAARHGRRPEEISQAKLFPRAAAAHFRLVEAIRVLEMIRQANPGVEIAEPDWGAAGLYEVHLKRILVEERKGPRRKRKYSKARTRVVALGRYEEEPEKPTP